MSIVDSIRKQFSPITPEVIATELLPRISLLKKEAAK